MPFLYMTLFALAVAGADQISKYFTVANIALHQDISVIPGLVGLTYERNYGAAFSSFQGMQWLFALVFVAVTVLLVVEYFKKPLPFTAFDRWCIAAVWGGGLGNMIDRVRMGYVVDMIETEFITFPVFNVADSFITCGCILLMVHLIFFNKAFWKDDKT